jgi:hypothetical protein
VAIASLCACAGVGISPASPTAAPASVMSARFPSAPTYGVAAHYIVYQTRTPGARPALAVLQAQTTRKFLDALHAVPVPNATIVYPDGSTQRTDSQGWFDAATSRYAQRHPQRRGAPNVPVRVIGESPHLSVTTNIFAPSPADEANIASGAILSSVLDRVSARIHPSYAFSCDPANYRDGRKDVTAGTMWTSPRFEAAALLTYYPLFGYCGIDNSFFDSSMVVSVRHWSSPLGASEPPTRPGCDPPPSNLCTVRIWYTDATFSTSVSWASNPHVALWFEAWNGNLFRWPSDDVHQVLLRVR